MTIVWATSVPWIFPCVTHFSLLRPCARLATESWCHNPRTGTFSFWLFPSTAGVFLGPLSQLLPHQVASLQLASLPHLFAHHSITPVDNCQCCGTQCTQMPYPVPYPVHPDAVPSAVPSAPRCLKQSIVFNMYRAWHPRGHLPVLQNTVPVHRVHIVDCVQCVPYLPFR